MGRLKERHYESVLQAGWVEVETAALLELPRRHDLEGNALEAMAALPTGTAISAETAISAGGAVSVMLRQFGLGWEGDVFPQYLEVMAPVLTPGVRLLAGLSVARSDEETIIVPEWLELPKNYKAPQPVDRDDQIVAKFPKPPATWPWNIKQALASIAASGGGSLTVTAKNLRRTAQIIRRVGELREDLTVAAYALPNDNRILKDQLNCRTMLDDPALIGFEVRLSGKNLSAALPDLVAIALFGTIAGEPFSMGNDEVDLRLAAGSRHAPTCLIPSLEDASSLLGAGSLRKDSTERPWILGVTGGGTPISLEHSDRARHLYMIGATGTGKSTLLKSLILQDVYAGEGVIVIDPHGDLAEDIEAEIPSIRSADLIYADAANLDGRFAIDLLPKSADSTSFEIAADMLVSIFKGALYADTPEGFGPVFESYFRNALALLAGAAEADRCLATFPRIFDDPRYRRELVEACTIPSVSGFWRSATRAGGEIALENITPYITSKLTRFVASDHARAMFPVSTKTLDFEDAMDNGKIVMLRCPKGTLGEGLSDLAMSASLMKIRAIAMARAGNKHRRQVRVYVDEFQNCRGNSMQTLLAEGRKFGISLVLANQSLGQIGGTSNNSLGAAALANVGNLITFRLGAADAMTLAPWLDSPDRWRELCQLPDFMMNARLLEYGRPVNYKNLKTLS